jgi:hypothetical protein
MRVRLPPVPTPRPPMNRRRELRLSAVLIAATALFTTSHE